LWHKFGMSRNLTTEEFIAQALAVHGDKYDYSQSVYTKSTGYLTIICPEHGPFKMQAIRHTCDKRGCKACNTQSTKFVKEFVDKARAVHGDRYDYSQAVYVKAIKPVTIICKEHGPFQQQARHHLNGHHCPACAGRPEIDTEEFIRRAQELHGDRYDYTQTVYRGKAWKVTVKCPEHGLFEQRAADHMRRGYGCPVCAQLVRNEKQTLTHDQFIDLSRTVHGDRYDYSKAVYTKSIEPVTIICREHGAFEQLAAVHVRGSGCPRCAHKISNPEIEIKALLESWRPDLEWVANNRTLIKPQELDLYCPELKLAVEYNGARWHSEEFKPDHLYHQKKSLAVSDAGARLIHVWEHHWRDPLYRTRMEHVLRHALGLSQPVGARTLTLGPLDPSVSRELLHTWHAQGSVGATHHLALWDRDQVMAVMTFGRPRFNRDRDWELLRYCNRPGYRVQGGASRLLREFVRTVSGSVMTYAALDRTAIHDCMYARLGFVLDGFTDPGYCWVSGRQVVSRYQAQAARIGTLLPDVDLSLSENDRMRALGFCKLYDSGNARFLLPTPYKVT